MEFLCADSRSNLEIFHRHTRMECALTESFSWLIVRAAACKAQREAVTVANLDGYRGRGY